MNRFTVIAINDEKDFCECCGKNGLKRVVWIADSETDVVKHFGTSCAVSPVKGFGVDREVKEAIRKVDARAQMVNILANQAYKKAGGKFGPMNLSNFSFPHADPELFRSIKEKISLEGKFNF